MFRSAAGITGSPNPEIAADVRLTLPKSLMPVKNDRSRTRFPTVMFSKNVHVSVGLNSLFAQNFMTARCLKCSVSARFGSNLQLAMSNLTRTVRERLV